MMEKHLASSELEGQPTNTTTYYVTTTIIISYVNFVNCIYPIFTSDRLDALFTRLVSIPPLGVHPTYGDGRVERGCKRKQPAGEEQEWGYTPVTIPPASAECALFLFVLVYNTISWDVFILRPRPQDPGRGFRIYRPPFCRSAVADGVARDQIGRCKLHGPVEYGPLGLT